MGMKEIAEECAALSKLANLIYDDVSNCSYSPASKMKKYRPTTESDERALANAKAKRRKKNKNKKTHRK